MSTMAEPIALVQPWAHFWHGAGQGISVPVFCNNRSSTSASPRFEASAPETRRRLRRNQIHVETSCSKGGLENHSGVRESWCCITADPAPSQQHHQCHHRRCWLWQWLCPEPWVLSQVTVTPVQPSTGWFALGASAPSLLLVLGILTSSASPLLPQQSRCSPSAAPAPQEPGPILGPLQNQHVQSTG